MTVGVTLKFPGITTSQYDQTCSLMGLVPRGAGPAGLLYHWAAVDGTGMVITDVWNDRERFEDFAQNQIGPFSAQAGVTEPPDTTIAEVHNFLTSGALGDTSAPVAVISEFEGDLKQYDEVIDLMGFTPHGAGADGGMFHWATAIEGGIRTTDVWQDRATFEAFAETQIGPYAAKVGAGPPSSVTFYDVYNYFTAGA